MSSELLVDLAPSFQRALRAEGARPGTLRLHGQAVRFFTEWVGSTGRVATVDDFDRATITAWIDSLRERGLSEGTVRTRWLGLSRFGRWMHEEEIIHVHPMRGMKIPKRERKDVDVLTDDQLARLIKECSGRKFNDRRDEAVVRVLLNCGVRVSELCGLRLSDVDLDRECAVVTGKGGKVRTVYFHSRTTRALDRYLRMRRTHRWASADAVFVGERGPLTPDGVRDLVRMRAEAADLPHIHPHQFRHTFAHDHLAHGGQERDLMRLAGWATSTMLEVYGNTLANKRAEEAARAMQRGDRV